MGAPKGPLLSVATTALIGINRMTDHAEEATIPGSALFLRPDYGTSRRVCKIVVSTWVVGNQVLPSRPGPSFQSRKLAREPR